MCIRDSQTEDALKQVGDSVDAADKSAVEADIAAVKSFLDAHKEACLLYTSSTY